MVGTNLGKGEWHWEEKLRWLNPICPNSRWLNSRWLPSLGQVRMNEFESDWISLSLSQSEWSFFVQMVATNLGKCEWLWEEKLRWLNPKCPNSRWLNSRLLPSSGQVRMNDFESDWISLSLSQSGVRVSFEWIWENITRCLNTTWQCLDPRWQNSRWLPSSCWVRMNGSESD